MSSLWDEEIQESGVIIMTFPLKQWFDITKKISKTDVALTEAQMVLYAVKENRDPDSLECKQEYLKMRKAVASHNKRFGT